MEGGLRLRESVAIALWGRAVGPQAAAATVAEEIRDGVLFVRTRSSVWSHELSLHKARLLSTLNSMLGAHLVKDVVFRARGVTAPPEQEPEFPSLQELESVELEPAEQEELDSHLDAITGMPDAKIRKSLASRLAQDAGLRHWRLEHGWRLCMRCGAAHHTEERLCALCRITG